ncbi:hypothetical protein PMAC_002724 [Pneumocystis sp. 'macacae']|nr:hypothetical protein PMAC_002724 [Pneumocystis sp. 'macacae']
MVEESSQNQKIDRKSFEKGCLLIEFILNCPDFTATRIPSLYSDFSALKESNPEGYKANICAWKYALQEAVWAGRITWKSDYLVIYCDSKLLASLYTTKYGTPLGMVETMEEALSSGDWMRLDCFLKKRKPIYAYLISFMSSMVTWSLQGIGLLSRKSRRFNAVCVIMQHVECAANAFLALVQDRTMYSDHIYSLNELLSCFSNKVLPPRVLSRLDMQIVVHYLSAYRKEICTCSNGQLRSKTKPVADDVNQTDMFVFKLKTIRDQLQHLVTTLTDNVTRLDETVKAAVKTKNKALALFHLRSKKSSQSTLEKRLQALEQIKQMLSKIDEAAINLDILNSMKCGSDVLETLLNAIGGFKNVELVIERAKMLSCELKDIGKVLGEVDLAEVSDAQIEQEFQALLRAFADTDIKDAASDAVSSLLSHIDLSVPPTDPSAVPCSSPRQPIKIVE